MSISYRARRRGALHALCAVMAAAALCAFSWQAAFAADSAPPTADAATPAAAGAKADQPAAQQGKKTLLTWQAVDDATGHPVSNVSIVVKDAKSAEVFSSKNGKADASLGPGAYTIEAGAGGYGYADYQASFTVLPDGTFTGLDSADSTIRMKSKDSFVMGGSIRWEGSEPPANIQLTWVSYNDTRIREDAVLSAANNWSHTYSLPRYIDGTNGQFTEVLFNTAGDDERIHGAYVAENKVWYLDHVEYPSSGRVYVMKFAREVNNYDQAFLDNHTEIPGATVQIVNEKTGKAVDEWVTGATPRQLNLTPGNYIYREIKAPLGWDIAEDIHFSVSVFGVINQDGVINIGSHVMMNEKKTVYPALVSKRTAEGAALAGAHLQILQDGTVVRDWTSGDSAFQADLTFGSYVLHEAGAPEGYEPFEDVAFRVEPDGTFTVEGGKASVDSKDNTLVVVDEKIVVPNPDPAPKHDGGKGAVSKKPAEDKPASAKKAKNLPATADGAAPLAAGAAAAAALAGVLALGVAARRKNAA